MKEAFVTVLLRLLLRFIGTLCAFTVLPGKLIVSLSLRFIEVTRSPSSKYNQIQRQPQSQQQRQQQQQAAARRNIINSDQGWWIREPLLWLPRWLVFNTILLAYIAQVGIIAATLRVSSNAGYVKTGLLTSVAMIVVFVYGNEYAKKDPWLCSWFPRAPFNGREGVFSACLEVNMDLIALFALLWCCLTGLRLPYIVEYARQRKNGRQPSSAYRAWPAQARSEFVFFWMDLLRYITYVLTPFWRWEEQVQAHSRVWTTAPASMHDSSHIQYNHYLQMDTTFAIGIAISGLTDFPIYVGLALVSPLTFWRLQETIQGLRGANGDRDICRSVALRQLLLCIADLVTVIASLPVLFTWRGFEMWEVFLAIPHGSRKREAWRIVWKLLIDIFDIPHFVMAFIITVTLWRTRSLWIKLEGPHTRKEIQKIIEKSFVSWLLDIPCAFLFLIVLITGWRAGNMIRGLKAVRVVKRQREQQRILQQHQQQILNRGNDVERQYLVGDDMPPPPAPPMLSDWQSVVLEESSQLMLDAPYPVLALFTLWRFPALLKNVFTDCDTAWERRALVLKYLMLVLMDVPCAIMGSVICITLWRIPTLLSAIASIDSVEEEFHRAVLGVFKEWLLDIPSVICYLLACILAPWRIPFVIIDVLEYTYDSRDARSFGYHLLRLSLEDLLSIIMLAVSLLASIRRSVVIYHLLHPVPHSVIPRVSISRPLNNPPPEAALLAATSTVFPPSSSATGTTTSSAGKPSLQEQDHDQNSVQKDMFYDRRQQAVRWNDGWFSVRVHWSAWLAWSSSTIDLWIIVMILVIFLGIFQVPSFLLSMYSLTALYRRKGRTKNEPATVLWDYNSGVRQRMSYFEPPDAPLSLILYEYSISNHFFSTLNNLPHLLFLPLKMISLVLFPVSKLIRLRFGTVANPIGRRSSSFLISVVRSMNEHASQELSFWTAHKYAVVVLFCTILVVFNELALLLLPINMLLLFISTAGFPLWSKFVDSTIVGDHASPILQRLLRSLVFILTTLAAPIIAVTDLALLVSPIIAIHVFVVPAYGIIIGVICSLSCVCIWAAMMHMTRTTIEEDFEWFSPLAAYTWVYERLFSQTFWKRYVALLDKVTEWCYPLRRARYGLIGEILLILFSFVWISWPSLILLAVVPRASPYWLLAFIVAFQSAVFLLHRAYHIVRRRWTLLTYGTHGYPFSGVKLTSVVPVLQPGSRYGFALEICGNKPSDFHVSDARLRLHGTKFWTAISSAMGPFWITVLRNVFYPIQLSPTFMDLSPLSAGITHCTCVFTFGTIDQPKLLHVSHHTLRRYLDQTAASGDPSVTVVIDYGHRSWGLWVIDGRLITFSLRIGALRDALFCSGGRRINLLETGGASIAPSDAVAANTDSRGRQPSNVEQVMLGDDDTEDEAL